MSSISLRHLARQLRQARHAQAQAQAAQQLAEQQLAELRARSQAAAGQASALLHTMSTAILAENEDHVVTLLNQRLCDLFGLSEDAAAYQGRPTAGVLEQGRTGPRDPAAFGRHNTQLMAGQQRTSGTLLHLRNGTVVQQDYLPVVQQGRTVLHVWSYEDVTLRHQAQQRVQELSRLAEQSPQPIIRFGPAGEALYANPAAAPVLEALARPEAAEAAALLRQEIARALQRGTPNTLEQRLGDEFYLWTVAPLSQAEGANVYLTNLTERRRTEAELHYNQLFTTRIADTVPNIVFLLDMDTRSLLYCNPQSEAVLGYTPEEMLALGPRLGTLLHPDDLAVSLRKQRELFSMADGEIISSEYRFRHRNGSWRWLNLKSAIFTRHPSGQVWQMVGSATDVTERRTTEEQLRQSRLLIERVTDTTPNLIYIFDLEQQCNVYCNRYIETTLGYTEAEIQAMGTGMFNILLPPQELERLQAHMQQVAEAADGEILTLEYSIYHRNGSLRWLRIRTTPFARNADGRVQQLVGSGEDITLWKLADEQRRVANRHLAEQNRLFRQVIDTVPNLIHLKDAAGNYVLANAATAQLFGLSLDALTKTNAQALAASFPDLERYTAYDRQVIASGQELAREDTFTGADGRQRWFYSIKRPFVLADGTVQVLGVDNDITELKRTEQDLQLAKEVAEENARARQTFLTNMSHEIRTPMNGVLGLAALLAKTPLQEQQQQYLHHIRQSAESLLVVINDILDMAQLGAGRIRLETVPFELRDVLKDSCQALLPKATEKGISLRLELPPAAVPTRVLGDPHRLRQVLLNLLSNAIKFTERGHVLLRCQPEENPTGSPRFQFAVLDTGIGIPEGQLEQLFEPFMQASASTAREYGGSGLGLSIARGLVELLGGRLTAESRLHHGSTFRFSLPFGQAPEADPPAAPAPCPNYAALRGYRVLLTEDNAVNQLLVQTMLRGWGLEVDAAASGPEALALFRQHRYDVVLMDIQMPGMDGMVATRLLREHPDPERARTPVVAFTAHAMAGEAERYRAAGLDAYLSKPFREAELFQTIAGLLPNLPALPCGAAAGAPPQPCPKLYDLSNLRQFTNQDETFIRRLVRLFSNTTPPLVEELETHLAQRQVQPLSAAAHQLKSSVGGLQIQVLLDPLRALETAATAPTPPDWSALAEHVHIIRATLNEVIRQLGEEFAEEGAAQAR
ncbi:PAS domain S-box protein [Hymenobacter weizhouensis]|uniref:PAS domain S-box protein n=1 Tax=Hymenobacter sp. YIM 151500-1 TaxID=2987689 RepID=UPI00222677F6|nr:PAS domain S-box protein [Hymenobacter sp. YIM 151500-1]UYZ62654.1 PAS domain S-box protein [Hymenobacter sp. YIM 151500-1]